MVVKLEGAVDSEMVDKLIQAENDCPHGEELIVFFSSQGGSADSMEVLIDIINESEKISVVKVYSIIYSAGFILTMKCQKYVEVLEGCLGMAHRAAFPSVGVKDNLKIPNELREEMILASKSAKKLIKDLIKLDIFSKKEIKRIRKGDDVFFSCKRLREMREVIWSPIQMEIDEYIEEYKARMEAEQEKIVEEENTKTEESTPDKAKAQRKTTKKIETNLEVKE